MEWSFRYEMAFVYEELLCMKRLLTMSQTVAVFLRWH